MQQAQRTVRLSSQMSVMGVEAPEKMAQGPCPCCERTIEVWVTRNGVELSAHDKGYDCGSTKADAHLSFQFCHRFQQMLKNIIRGIK